MSRHRNVRSMNYNDEYDGYDDVYGHSVEDDYCISPSDAAEFLYDRTRQPQMSAFFSEEDNIVEEDESTEGREHQADSKPPVLNDLDECKLRSCLDEIRNVIGDSLPENILVEIILKSDFQVEKALDTALSSVPSAADKKPAGVPKPQRTRKDRERDDDDIVSPEFCDLFDDLIRDDDINGIRKDMENMEICRGSRNNRALSLIGNLVLDSDSSHCSDSDIVAVKEKISSLHGLSSLTNNLRGECVSDIDDLLESISNKPICNRTIPASSLDSPLQREVQSLNNIPSFSPSQPFRNSVGYEIYDEQTISEVDCASAVLQNSGFHKARLDSDKENVEVVSPVGSEDEDLLTPNKILARQNKKLAELKRKMAPYLTPPNLSQVKRLSNVPHTITSSEHNTVPNENYEKTVSSPHLMRSNVFAVKQSCREGVYTSKQDSKSKIGFVKDTFSREKSWKPGLQGGKQQDHVLDDELISPPHSCFLGRQKLMVEVTENYPLDNSSSEDDDMDNFSPLLSLAKQHVRPQPTSSPLVTDKLGSKVRSEVNLLEDPVGMVYDSESESELSSERSDLMLLTNTMSDSLSVSQESEKEAGSISSLASLIARHNNFGLSSSSQSNTPPPSSLFDLATHHLTRSSSCWKVKADGEAVDKKSVSLTDASISKSVPARFFIPPLGMQESSMSSKSEGLSTGQDDTSEQSEDADEWVFDLSSALRIPGSVPHNETGNTNSEPKIVRVEIVEPSAEIEHFPCELDASKILKRKFRNAKRKSSSFGKALCRKWRDLALPYIPPRPRSTGSTVPFLFDTISPDDEILKNLRRLN